MKILLSGAQSSGKSTLVKALDINRLPKGNWTKYDSMSARFMRKAEDQFKPGIGEQFEFQQRISLYCLNLYVNEDDIIASRSTFDSLAYPIYHGERAMVDMVRSYENLLFRPEFYYFFIPVEHEISSDNNPLRIVDKQYQKDIENIIRREFEIAKIAYGDRCNFHTLSGTVEERLEQIYKAVNK